MRQGILAFFGKYPLDQIDFPLVRRYEAKVLARGVKTRGHVNLVRSVLRAAVELRILPKFPDVPTAKGPGKKLPRAPTCEEVEQMLEHTDDWVRTAIVLAFYAGLRSGELRALQVRDVDFERGLIYVRRAFSEDVLQDRPKDNDERIIPIAGPALAELQRAARGLNTEDFLVRNRNGTTPNRQGVLARRQCSPEESGARTALRRPRSAPWLLHGARAQQRGRRDGEGARGSRGPPHHPALPALRALGLGRSDGDVLEQLEAPRRHLEVGLATGLEMTRGPKKNPRVTGDLVLCFSRGGQIRTADLSDPNRARYQTALRPETEAADNGPRVTICQG